MNFPKHAIDIVSWRKTVNKRSLRRDRSRTAARLRELRKQAKQNRAAKIQVEALDRAFLEAFKRLLQSSENIDENKFGIRLGK